MLSPGTSGRHVWNLRMPVMSVWWILYKSFHRPCCEHVVKEGVIFCFYFLQAGVSPVDRKRRSNIHLQASNTGWFNTSQAAEAQFPFCALLKHKFIRRRKKKLFIFTFLHRLDLIWCFATFRTKAVLELSQLHTCGGKKIQPKNHALTASKNTNQTFLWFTVTITTQDVVMYRKYWVSVVVCAGGQRAKGDTWGEIVDRGGRGGEHCCFLTPFLRNPALMVDLMSLGRVLQWVEQDLSFP